MLWSVLPEPEAVPASEPKAVPASEPEAVPADLSSAEEQAAVEAAVEAALEEAAFEQAMDAFELMKDVEQAGAGEAALDQWARDIQAATALATLAEVAKVATN
mmetsp:Transcript_15253/g.35487  ORF Transcript_15253/g.35487 Transcript_15253/m.35487 type:complete len:103 (-) Transcript_15253:399-707(-)